MYTDVDVHACTYMYMCTSHVCTVYYSYKVILNSCAYVHVQVSGVGVWGCGVWGVGCGGCGGVGCGGVVGVGVWGVGVWGCGGVGGGGGGYKQWSLLLLVCEEGSLCHPNMEEGHQ